MDDEASIVSIIGSCRRTNRWRIAEETSVKTLFGRCYLDMREADCDAKLIELDIVSVFANVTIIVPDGCDIRPSGGAILGSFSCLVPVSDKTCKLPPIEIESNTIFGRLRIATISEIPAKKKRRWRRKQQAITPPLVTPAEPTQSVQDALGIAPEPEEVDVNQPDFAPVSGATFVDMPEIADEAPEPVDPATLPSDAATEIDSMSNEDAPSAPTDIVDEAPAEAGPDEAVSKPAEAPAS